MENYQDIDLDQHLQQESEEIKTEEDIFLSELTQEEKDLLKRIEEKKMKQDYIMQLFEELESKPSKEELEMLKQQCGEVYFVPLGDSGKENFIFRSIKRLEWRTLMNKIAPLDEYKKAEAIVMKGVVHPQLNQQNINILAAGSIDTLRELILQASNFMPADYAMQLVRKL